MIHTQHIVQVTEELAESLTSVRGRGAEGAVVLTAAKNLQQLVGEQKRRLLRRFDEGAQAGSSSSSQPSHAAMMRECVRTLQVTLRARWVTLRARWVTLRARWVTLRARGVTLRAPAG
jgi:hypothetical protein